jgi:hypothetical protein
MPPRFVKPSLEQQKVGFRPLISSAILPGSPTGFLVWGRFAGAHTAPYRTAEQTCSLFQDTPKTMNIQSHSVGRLNSIDVNQIVCPRHLGRKPRIYRMDEIAALVMPGYHTPTLIALIAPVAVIAGSIVGAVILMPTAVAAGVVLAIVAGLPASTRFSWLRVIHTTIRPTNSSISHPASSSTLSYADTSTTHCPLLLLSIPSTLQNPPKQLHPNYLIVQNSWHSSYAQPAILKLELKKTISRPILCVLCFLIHSRKSFKGGMLRVSSRNTKI